MELQIDISIAIFNNMPGVFTDTKNVDRLFFHFLLHSSMYFLNCIHLYIFSWKLQPLKCYTTFSHDSLDSPETSSDTGPPDGTIGDGVVNVGLPAIS